MGGTPPMSSSEDETGVKLIIIIIIGEIIDLWFFDSISLSYRLFCVDTNDIKSHSSPLPCGVRQSSMLGLFLFFLSAYNL